MRTPMHTLVLVREAAPNNSATPDAASLESASATAQRVCAHVRAHGGGRMLIHSGPRSTAHETARVYARTCANTTSTVNDMLSRRGRDDDEDVFNFTVRKVEQHILAHLYACNAMVIVLDLELLNAVLNALVRAHNPDGPLPTRSRLEPCEAYALALPGYTLTEFHAPEVLKPPPPEVTT